MVCHNPAWAVQGFRLIADRTGHESSGRLTRRIAVFAGGVAIVGMGAPRPVAPTASRKPFDDHHPVVTPATPTEKAVSPGGPNPSRRRSTTNPTDLHQHQRQ